jgi:hypothetical protein
MMVLKAQTVTTSGATSSKPEKKALRTVTVREAGGSAGMVRKNDSRPPLGNARKNR